MKHHLWGLCALGACMCTAGCFSGRAQTVTTALAQKKVPATTQTALPPAQQTAQEASFLSAEAQPPLLWQNTDCAALPIPTQTQGTLTCRKTNKAFCALFEKNGQVFYCQTTDGTLSHQSNIWGSSLTVTRYDQTGRMLQQRYYAYGQLARAADFDYMQNNVWRFWWEDNQIRLTQQDVYGKIRNKFYFPFGKPYIHYPDGNDMGERNGVWEIKDGYIFIDGALLCPLPPRTPAPDSCTVFAGVCPAAQTELL